MTTYLVSCVSDKLDVDYKVPAKDLYISDWFKKARAYVESTGCPWFILSALYTCLAPTTQIHPYNLTLEYRDGNDRIRQQTWAKIAASNLHQAVFHGSHLIILAGMTYRRFLEPELRSLGYTTEVPLAGMGIGQQKRWLMEHTP